MQATTSQTVQGGELSDEPVELRSVQTTPTKRKRDDEGNNTDSENDAEQDYKRRKIAEEADKEFAQALEAAKAADAEEADKQLAQALEAAEAADAEEADKQLAQALEAAEAADAEDAESDDSDSESEESGTREVFGQDQEEGVKTVSRSKKAGLQFPVGRVHRHLEQAVFAHAKAGNYAGRIGNARQALSSSPGSDTIDQDQHPAGGVQAGGGHGRLRGATATMMDLADIDGGGSGGYISHASAGPQPSEEERRAAARAAAEKRAKSQALRGVSGRTPLLSTKADTSYRGRNTLEFSDAATWN